MIATPLRSLLPKLREIVEHHLQARGLGSDVDPQDGLLSKAKSSINSPGWMRRSVIGL